MTMTNLASNSSRATNFIRATQTFGSATPDPKNCRSQISCLVSDIESQGVREVVGVVFNDLLRLSECLDLIEVHLRKVEFAEQTFELFQLIHDDASGLVDFIHTE